MKWIRFKLKQIIVGVLLLQICIMCFFTVYNACPEHTVSLENDMSKNRENHIRFGTDMYANRTITKYQNRNNFKSVSSVPILNSSGDCVGLKYNSSLAVGDTWYPVEESHHAYVFSAYLERSTGVVTIIGAGTHRGARNVYCQFWYMSTNRLSVTMTTVTAKVTAFSEGHSRRYTACKFTCQLPNDVIPTTVSISNGKCTNSLNQLPVTELRPGKYSRNFTICSTPFSIRYGRAYELVEWIELNRILGIDHFIFYNYSSAINVVQVLDFYSKRGLAEVVQWHLPMGVDTWPKINKPVEIHYFGQMAYINDCLLRNKYSSKFVAFIDLDEFIIPHFNSMRTLGDIIQSQPNSGAYIFRNTFFRKEWNNTHYSYPKKEQAVKYNLVSLLKIERENKIWPAFQRSKYIIRPEEISRLGIHDVAATSLTSVPPGVAMLHHYRNWERYDDTQTRVKDDVVVTKYKDVLIDNVVNIWSQLKHVKMDIPI